MKPLDPIAVSLDTTTLIEASAGTGKTYTIATLFLRLLLERELLVSEILVVTYTRAATAELRDRIRRRLLEAIDAIDAIGAGSSGAPEAALGPDPADDTLDRLFAARSAAGELQADRRRLEQAVRNFDEAAIFTIHGFCQRTLTEHAFESKAPFEAQLLEHQAPLLAEIAQDYWATLSYDAQPELIDALRKGRAAPNELEKLAAKAVRSPRMPVLPDALPETTLPSAAFYAARDRAAALWREEREGILLELCKKERLNANSHSPKRIREKWAPEMDALDTVSPVDLPDYVSRLTTQGLVKATKKNFSPPQHAFFDVMSALHESSQALSAALSTHVLVLRRQMVDYARTQAAARRRERGVQSFDDLLEQLSIALEGDGGVELAGRISKRHPAALIDEFQDTDPVQYGIFRRLYADTEARLFLIGDPKQAIYGFRGADIFAYMQAARAAGQAAYTLDVSYRCDPRLLCAINALFSRARRPFLFPEIEFDRVRPGPKARERLSGDAPALQLLFVPRSADATSKGAITSAWAGEHLPQMIADEIVQLLQSGATIDDEPLRPRDVAVLCRTNQQAADTQAALRERRVPTVLDGDSSVFETPIAEELSNVLWAVARPADTRRHAAALVSSILGVSGEGLYRMRADETGLEPWLERFARLNLVWHERGFVQMLHRLFDEAGTQQKLLSRVDGERRLTDLLHLSELLHQASVQQHLGPLSLLAWFSRVRADPQAAGDLAAESTQVRLEHDEHALKLTTVHRSKGLEYPIVFCPFMALGRAFNEKDVRFHDRNDHDRIKLDLGSPDHAQHAGVAAREELAENLRLLYVALTRAKHRCYLVFGRFSKSGLSPVAYLLQQHGGAQPLEPKELEQRIEALDDDQLRAEASALCEAAEGAIGVRDLRLGAPATYAGLAPATAGELRARTSTRALSQSPRVSSFSRLTAEHGTSVSTPAEQGLDLDETAQSAAAPEEPDALAAREQTPITLHDFPQGSRPGTLIHSIYEHIDFGRSDPDELPARAQSALRTYGLDPERHAQALVQGIDQSLRAPLDDASPPLTLASVAREHRLDELEFTLSTPRARATLSAARLASVLERFGAPACAPDYPERLRALRMLPPTGFLKGFIDLVFRSGERFYIVDYKSNWLGGSAADYQPAQLVDAMREHHYFLQYHLYTVALHHHLELRLPGYDYARNFGGVYYLFMRGMSPEHPLGSGVFFDRPKLALIEALAQALGGREAAA